MGILSQSTNSSTLSATVEPVHGVIKCVKAIIHVCRSKTDVICYIEDIKDDLQFLSKQIVYVQRRMIMLITRKVVIMIPVHNFRAEVGQV